jgi:ATP-dependent RNA helicase DHX8/PRP22
MQAELQADGVGDHVFLLRLAEVTADRALEADLVATLRLNGRALAFARKVRAQLAATVETRVWPLHARRARRNGHDHQHGDGQRDAGERGHKRSRTEGDGQHEGRGDRGRHDSANGRQREQLQRPPDLGDVRGRVASAAEVDALRRALAVGYAPHLAKRMPMHNGYRTLAATKASVACAFDFCAVHLWQFYRWTCFAPCVIARCVFAQCAFQAHAAQLASAQEIS